MTTQLLERSFDIEHGGTCRYRIDNRIITESIAIESAEVAYTAILDAVQFAPDPYPENPLETDDGFEHDYIQVGELARDEVSQARGYINDYRCTGGHLIVVTAAQREAWGVRGYAKKRGASKQVAKQLEAENVARTIDAIKSYRTGEYTVMYGTVDFMDCHASLYGIIDPDAAYIEQVKDGLAGEVAAELRERGYTIIAASASVPDPASRRASIRARFQERLNSQNYSGRPRLNRHHLKKPRVVRRYVA